MSLFYWALFTEWMVVSEREGRDVHTLGRHLSGCRVLAYRGRERADL